MTFEQVWTDFYRGGRGAVAVLLGVMVLAACQTTSPPPRPTRPVPTAPPVETPDLGAKPKDQTSTPEVTGPGGLVPPHMEDRDLVRIGLLLPFSAKSAALRDEARSMLSAAQMALFAAADPRLVLLPKDTGGTALGAQSAAAAVIKDGAAIILGPVLGSAVSAASRPASRADIPLIAFSTDKAVAGNGVYLLSFLPEADMTRMMDYIHTHNQKTYENFSALRSNATTRSQDVVIRTLALLRPNNRYGDRIEQALFATIKDSDLFVSDIARYGRDSQSMSAPARQIAHVDERNAAIRAWKKEGGIGDPSLSPSFHFSLPYQAVIIPESGVRLRSLAPLLPFYDVDPKITQFIGTSLWNDEELLREPALFGGWFPAPNAADRGAFTERYERYFGELPSRLASLAHDGVSIIPQTLNDEAGALRIDHALLERAEGFRGADGLFRFGEDGLVQRLLSVFEIRQGAFREIDPAADGFSTDVGLDDTGAF